MRMRAFEMVEAAPCEGHVQSPVLPLLACSGPNRRNRAIMQVTLMPVTTTTCGGMRARTGVAR